ncbi:hypothetical protein RND81_13G194700 [Saponaria officinalis]|uniref:Pectinesterase inhibitor domain-containing protein n=1 Tax=Saponaria officinalis TaxID=3572 RepID=A0AAW1H2V8_SAPOF
MNLNRNTLVISAIFFVTCLINSPSTQANDEQIVTRMCGETDNPTVCKNCIDNSGREVSQELDVIVGSIRCTYNDNYDLINSLTQFASDASDVKVKNVVNGCVQDYKSVQDGLITIVQEASKQSFVTAKGLINSLIYPKMNACDDAVKQSGIVIPPTFFGGSITVAGDLKLMSQLLSIIKA